MKHLEEKFLLVLTLFADYITNSWTALIYFNIYLPQIDSSCCSYMDLLKNGLYSLIFLTLLFSHIEFSSSQGFLGFFLWWIPLTCVICRLFLSCLRNIVKGFIPIVIFFFGK